MPGKDHGPSIKKDDEYSALRKKGYSKEKAARISNADAKGQSASKKGGKKSSGGKKKGK